MRAVARPNHADEYGPLIVARAAYRLDISDEEWLRGLIEAANPFLDFGGGVHAACYRRTGDRFDFSALVSRSSTSYPFASFSPNDVPPAVRHAAFGMATPCSTARRIAASTRGGHVLRDLLDRNSPHLTAMDSLGLIGVDLSGHGVMLTSPSMTTIKWPDAKFTLWAHASVHLSTALRLRRAARAKPVAILDANAKVLHTENSGDAFCELLRQSARIVLRAASPGREANATMIAWRALVAGELSLIDTFDTDGKRLIIARRNRPATARVINDPLSTRERHVVEYARLGHPNKLIAYALGISSSTVGTHLRTAMRKLNVANRVALIKTRSTEADARL